MSMDEIRFAVLIDADNVAGKYINLILDEIAKDGVATYKRIYGDWTNPALISWKKVLLDNSVLPIQQYSYTTGKNATDSAMIIDAMDILYSGQVGGFCIVSSDSDFTRLAARLRESGMTVVGMGERKTPKSFISACNRFRYLDILAGVESERKGEAVTIGKDFKSPPEKKPIAKSKPIAKNRHREEVTEEALATQDDVLLDEPQTALRTIKHAIGTIILENSEEDDYIDIGQIGQLLGKRYPDFDARNFGFSKLSLLIKSFDMFEVKSERKSDGASPQMYVKLR